MHTCVPSHGLKMTHVLYCIQIRAEMRCTCTRGQLSSW